MKVYHDKDGKIYTYDKDGGVEWLFEVLIDNGDNVAKIVNNLIERSHNTTYQASAKKPTPKSLTNWYCEKCKQDVEGINVTFEETHEGCGGVCR